MCGAMRSAFASRNERRVRSWTWSRDASGSGMSHLAGLGDHGGMAERDACVFCGRSDRPMTREHVFARWLVQKIHGAQLLPTTLGAPDAAPVRISRVIATVCATCNAGWMSGLEVSFRRLVFARPRAGPVAAVDRTALSRWFTKTAVLLAHASGVDLVGADQRARLERGMPEGVEVFLARRRRPPQRLDFALDIARSEPVVRSVEMLVDDLVARVAPKGSLAGRHGTQLWPLRTHLLRWETLPVTARTSDPAAR